MICSPTYQEMWLNFDNKSLWLLREENGFLWRFFKHIRWRQHLGNQTGLLKRFDICIRAWNSKLGMARRQNKPLGGYVGTIRLNAIAALGWPVGNIVVGKQVKWGPIHTYPEIFVSAIFFYADTKISESTRSVYESYTTVHTYPIRMRTSQSISQQNSRGKRLDLILWRQRIQKYTDTSVHTYPDTQRIQKSPDTPSVYGGHVWTLGVSA